MAVLGLRFCVRAFSSCGKWGPLLIAVRGPLTIAASPVAEHRLQTRRLSSCGARASSLRGMWDPPRPGLEPVSPALAGRLSTTAPPGKPTAFTFCNTFDFKWWEGCSSVSRFSLNWKIWRESFYPIWSQFLKSSINFYDVFVKIYPGKNQCFCLFFSEINSCK